MILYVDAVYCILTLNGEVGLRPDGLVGVRRSHLTVKLCVVGRGHALNVQAEVAVFADHRVARDPWNGSVIACKKRKYRVRGVRVQDGVHVCTYA